jgi:hypothetical protein
MPTDSITIGVVMLNSLGTQKYYADMASSVTTAQQTENKYTRNEESDMQKAIGYLYDFKKKLDELHPNCTNLIENMLQKPTNRY